MSMRDYSRFIYFHPSTKGTDGKDVYIDRTLIGPFVDLVDLECRRGIDLATQLIKIAEVKSTAGNINSDSNMNTPGLNRSTFGPLMVEYFVFQHKTELNRGPGVYIQDIRAIEYSEGEPQRKTGMYLVENKRGWGITGGIQNMETTVGAIGAHYNGAYFCAKNSAQKFGEYIHNAGKNSQDRFSLYYAPGYIINSQGYWLTAEQKQLPSGESQRAFAKILIQTLPTWSESSNPPVKHEWFVFEDGIKFLQEALEEFKKMVAGKNITSLAEHRFYLVNPKGNMGPLLSTLSELKARVPEKGSYHFDEKAIAAKFNQIANHDSMIKGLQDHRCSWQGIHKLSDPLSQKYQKVMQNITRDTTFSELVKKIIADIQGGWA